ncbi:MAG: glycosyltransferase, partial [Infirmifilum sp.]
MVSVARKQLDLALRYGLPIRKSVVVYNPPPETSFTGKELAENPPFIYVGGDSYIKGFYILLTALPGFIGSGVRLRLFGSYRRAVKAPNVEFVGRVPHDHLMQEHRRAWGLLLPSINEEQLPYAVVESVAAGTMPLVARVGGLEEVLEGTTAAKYFFRPNDHLDLLDKTIALASESPERVVEQSLETRGTVVKRLEES